MRIPRLLPIIAVAIGGVLAINAVAGARDLSGLVGGAKAFAEDVAAKAAPKTKTDKAEAAKPGAAKPDAKPEELKLAAAAPLPPRAAPGQAAAAPATVCKPTDAAIGREAGLSPEQMRLLESLQSRRGQLDAREQALEMQLNLISAAEAKLDQRVAALNSLKGEIQTLLGQADSKQKAESERMVGVYTTMAQSKPKEAAKQLTIMDDSVRLPIAAGLSNRNLATILANMQPTDAKKLNEALAHRFESQRLDASRAAQAAAAAVAAPTPAKPAPAKAAPPKTPAKAAEAEPLAAPIVDGAKTAPVKTAQAPPKPKPRPKPAAKKPDPADGAAPMKTEPAAEGPAAAG
jgi:flagellar motility protein MotE (MotC chaperone)